MFKLNKLPYEFTTMLSRINCSTLSFHQTSANTMAEDFDLSKFITGSICLRDNSTPALKPLHLCKDPLAYIWEEDPLKLLGVLPFTERKQVPEDVIGTPIQEFYRGVCVFVTGGSGFLGKVLVEKLLRDVPHIGHIYVLIREKKGKSCQERFQLMMEDELFRRLKAEVPDYHRKITPLSGDIYEPDLGLSSEDRQMVLDSVQVVFHCAADVRFLEPLRKAINSNVFGSKRVMELAKQMTRLKSYIHVSTAYSQVVHRVLDETVPKMNINYKDILHYVDTNTDSHIEDNLERIMQEWPNTYTFSKAMCENMIQEEAGDLPICIFRPSIVTNTYKEPVRGWSDNALHVLGAMLLPGLGIVHHSRVDVNQPIDVVPVDYVANCMIAVAWRTSKKRDTRQLYVVNFTLWPQNIAIWKSFLQYDDVIDNWPLTQGVWYPSCIVTDSYWLDELIHFVVHRFQAVVLDTLASYMGKKPRVGKLFALHYSVKDKLHYFTSGFWEFKNDNVLAVWETMTKEDQQMFNFDVTDICIKEYFKLSCLGMKYFYLKESIESLPAARRRMKWLRIAHNTLKMTFGFFALKLAVNAARLLPF